MSADELTAKQHEVNTYYESSLSSARLGNDADDLIAFQILFGDVSNGRMSMAVGLTASVVVYSKTNLLVNYASLDHPRSARWHGEHTEVRFERYHGTGWHCPEHCELHTASKLKQYSRREVAFASIAGYFFRGGVGQT